MTWGYLLCISKAEIPSCADIHVCQYNYVPTPSKVLDKSKATNPSNNRHWRISSQQLQSFVQQNITQKSHKQKDENKPSQVWK